MTKTQTRHDHAHRRLPMPEMAQPWSAEDSVEKGRNHEAFDAGLYNSERRGLERALHFDRKR